MKTDPNDSVGVVIDRVMQLEGDAVVVTYPGLTKREHFAALAMQSYLAGAVSQNGWITIDSVSSYAVKMADALIAELNK
jgi:hypothetical protein